MTDILFDQINWEEVFSFSKKLLEEHGDIKEVKGMFYNCSMTYAFNHKDVDFKIHATVSWGGGLDINYHVDMFRVFNLNNTVDDFNDQGALSFRISGDHFSKDTAIPFINLIFTKIGYPYTVIQDPYVVRIRNLIKTITE